MERETIERLAMDAALGELNEDAAALLDAYLAEHPEAKARAQQMEILCNRTQEAIDAKAHSQPVYCLGRPRVSTRWTAALRWAAVIVVSLLLGAITGRWFAPREVALVRNVAVAPPPRTLLGGWQELLANPGQGFWASKAAALWQPQSPRRAEPQPRLWDTIRQLQRRHKDEQPHQ